MDKISIVKILCLTVVVVIAGIFTYWCLTRATVEQKKKVDKFLLWAVAKAQMELGKDTGPLKLSMVYGLFLQLFPTKITSKIPFAVFETMVIAAKAELIKLQKDNEAINILVTTGEVPK